MKIGCLFVGYNTEEYIHQSLSSWISARAEKLGGDEFVICAVSVPFEEYKGEPFKDETQSILGDYYNKFKIDHLITEPEFIPEKDARNMAAQYLINQGVDAIWLVDSDEIYDEHSIANISKYLQLERFCSWFRLPLTNYVFDKQTVLEEKFCPPRIWRVNTNGYKLDSCVYDNDFCYKSTGLTERKVLDKDLPSKTIPSKLVDIKHFSWLSDQNSKKKTIYQMKRWGKDGCGYKWNEEKDCLEFNAEYYKKVGQPIPRVVKISS